MECRVRDQYGECGTRTKINPLLLVSGDILRDRGIGDNLLLPNSTKGDDNDDEDGEIDLIRNGGSEKLRNGDLKRLSKGEMILVEYFSLVMCLGSLISGQ